MTDWIKNLKVGDKVVVHSWAWCYNKHRESTVTKITQTGRIRVKGYEEQFNQKGNAMGDYSSHLCNPEDEEVKRRVQMTKDEDFLISAEYEISQRIKEMTVEQAEKILEILGCDEVKRD